MLSCNQTSTRQSLLPLYHGRSEEAHRPLEGILQWLVFLWVVPDTEGTFSGVAACRLFRVLPSDIPACESPTAASGDSLLCQTRHCAWGLLMLSLAGVNGYSFMSFQERSHNSLPVRAIPSIPMSGA